MEVQVAGKSDNDITRGSDNVFADLGVADAGAHKTKAGLARQLAAIVEGRGLTQADAARLTGFSQPDISRLLRGHFRDVSVDRLMGALAQLDMDVEITVRARGESTGETIPYVVA